MRRSAASWLVLAPFVSACGSASPPPGGFPEFWDAFTAAVGQDSPAAVAELTAFPFLFEGAGRSRDEFDVIHSALFDEGTRSCLAVTQPVPEAGQYIAFCDPLLFVFGEVDGAWRMLEFAADPEAIADDDWHPADAPPRAGDRWRVIGQVPAPWAPPAGGAATSSLTVGAVVAFAPGRVIAPFPLGCDNADAEYAVTPAAGLFQGNLPRPAERAAATAGLHHLPVLTLSVRCDAGVFDYHFADADRLLLGLDNRIWTLAAEHASSTPRSTVLRFLMIHMTGDMGFDSATFEKKRSFVTPDLAGQVATYFARTHPPDEPPPINGDPITDSQEYPARFRLAPAGELGSLDATGVDRVRVPVVFANNGREHTVTFELVRSDTGWLLDDLVYTGGRRLTSLLQTQ